MNLKPNKRKIAHFFSSYSWMWLLSSALLCFGLWYGVSSVNAPRKEETFAYFFEAYELKENSIAEKSREVCPSLLKVDVYEASPDESLLTTKFSSFGLTSDFLLLLESDLDEMKDVIKSNLKSLDESSFSFGNDVEAYEAYGETFAFKLHDGENEEYNARFVSNSLFDFGDKQKSFYVCVPLDSVHYGEKTDYGFDLVSAFFKGELL